MFPFHQLLKADLAGDTLIVRPCADGIGFRYGDLQSELNRLLKVIDQPAGGRVNVHLIVDLGDWTYCGNEFLASVVMLLNRTAARGGRAVWCNGSQELLAFLAERGVATIWPYYGSRDEALSAVAAA